MPRVNRRFPGRVSTVEHLIGALSEVCAGLPDRRKGPPRDCDYTMADIGLSAFSTFFMGSPSFLAHQRVLAEGHGRSNCETLFGMSAIPCDNYIRLRLDGAAPAACGRARWKIENETFNVLKTNGYNLEHNFGYGKEALARVLVTLNLLAFAFHAAAYLAVLAWRAAVIARGPTYRFFEHLRTIIVYVVFRDWTHLLQSITAVAIRPP